MKTKQTFEDSLRKSNLSGNTISSYLWTIHYFSEHYDGITKENLLAYKGYLMEYFKPKTVNLRIQAINKYLDFLGKSVCEALSCEYIHRRKIYQHHYPVEKCYYHCTCK